MLGHVGGRHIAYCQAICHFLWSYLSMQKVWSLPGYISTQCYIFNSAVYIYHPCYFSTILALILPCKILYVPGFAKIVSNGTTTETKLTLKLHSRNIQAHKAYVYRWPSLLSQTTFFDPVKPWRCTTGPVEPVNGINKDLCCTELLPTTVLEYSVDYSGVAIGCAGSAITPPILLGKVKTYWKRPICKI